MLNDFKAFQFAKELHWACRPLKVPDFLRDQLLRASSSIALNIAEGSGKRTPNEQARFYAIALGSLRECQAIFALEKIEDRKISDLSNQLGAILFKLSHKRQPKLN